ncbi:hypothetical protein OPV22_022910 [Ensete ventricosum]|uniref:Orn/Lys/Arg decarboxylases family 1 pyridoxal-P attachment site domain-containing protein n=1 Tax=Ensete ventricosum TaxID=4639 RepID=A0AAV8QQV7_ENSVE|nr:hypothetical protein OPV22_022910 [Ensete ventricosum]
MIFSLTTFPTNLLDLPSVDRRPSVHVGWRRRHRNPEACACQTKKQAAAESTEDDSCGGVATYATNAPFVSALMAFAERDTACFHFPGHNRGKAAPAMLSQLFGPDVFTYDLSPIPWIGNLFSSRGPLSDAQKLAAEVFGSSETWFLVGGSSCGVMASIMATCSPGDFLVLPRNAHISATHAMVLSGALPKYITPECSSVWDVAGGVTPSQVETAIEELKEAGKTAAAVLITSPTYQGICCKIDEITKLCHSHGVPAIVDEAHGAHFKFHPRLPKTALEQGADLVVQSTHKVLSSLSQSSMLHASGHRVDRERVRRCLQALQSTSSSYLLLASLDATRAQLSENPEAILGKAMEMADLARVQIEQIPSLSILDASSFSSDFPDMDPLRVTVGVSRLGLTGFKVNELLCEEHGVMPELEGMRSVTFVFNRETSVEHTERLITALSHLSTTFVDANQSRKQIGSGVITPFAGFSRELSPREAFFAKKRKVAIGESLGEICGELICTIPPGVPVLNPGEVITREALDYLQDARSKGAVIMGAADPRLYSLIHPADPHLLHGRRLPEVELMMVPLVRSCKEAGPCYHIWIHNEGLAGLSCCGAGGCKKVSASTLLPGDPVSHPHSTIASLLEAKLKASGGSACSTSLSSSSNELTQDHERRQHTGVHYKCSGQ